MGPYCQFCDNRCFVPFPEGTPPEVLKAYEQYKTGVSIIATCPEGQRFERERVGYCYNGIRKLIESKKGVETAISN